MAVTNCWKGIGFGFCFITMILNLATGRQVTYLWSRILLRRETNLFWPIISCSHATSILYFLARNITFPG